MIKGFVISIFLTLKLFGFRDEGLLSDPSLMDMGHEWCLGGVC
jgi:hypothetical protein